MAVGKQESQVSGPYTGRDKRGVPDHKYWKCEDCGLESTDSKMKNGCIRCDN